jgi:hypothetical protein
MSQEQRPKRRPFQFSLRTFFVLVTLACVGFGYWVHWSREWIRQRQEAREEVFALVPLLPEEPPRAPCGLWLFGEKGVLEIRCGTDRIEQLKRLFPEARVKVSVANYAS